MLGVDFRRWCTLPKDSRKGKNSVLPPTRPVTPERNQSLLPPGSSGGPPPPTEWARVTHRLDPTLKSRVVMGQTLRKVQPFDRQGRVVPERLISITPKDQTFATGVESDVN